MYSTLIEIEYGNLESIINWCSEHFTNWGYSIDVLAGAKAGKYQFEFTSESDLITFILWKK